MNQNLSVHFHWKKSEDINLLNMLMLFETGDNTVNGAMVFLII